jgi:hypothetical protein
MDVPAGFHEFEPQGPFLEHIGPIHVRHSEDGPVFGLRARAVWVVAGQPRAAWAPARRPNTAPAVRPVPPG